MVMGIVAVTLPVFRSTLLSVWSPQLGTQRLPNAAARPEHGRLPTGIVAADGVGLGVQAGDAVLGLVRDPDVLVDGDPVG